MTDPAVRATSVRWWTLLGLSGFTFVSYLERSNISIAAALMIPELGISKVQMGQIFTAFLIGYALFQIPGGFLGDKYGPRATLAASAFVWGVATLLTGFLPGLLSGSLSAILLGLWLVRFFLGVAEATTFPVGNRAIHNWVPPSERVFGTSIMMLGSSAASAIVSPLVSGLMLRVGWRHSFYFTSVPALLIGAVWFWFSRDKPESHPRVNESELAHIREEPEGAVQEQVPSLISLLRQRNVYLLILSYISEGYVLFIFVFWLYLYLVEKRGFSMFRGGWAAALPWVVALLMTPFGGMAADRLGARYGRLNGAKIVIMAGYGLSGLLLFLAAYSLAVWVSVAALSLSIGFLMSAEASFWATATHLGGARVGILSGVMNTAGVLGGILSTSLVPVLVERFGWLAAFGSGTFMGLFCVCVWIAIREPRASVRL
jgi:MFS transporter, ACS family, glucarate transporter